MWRLWPRISNSIFLLLLSSSSVFVVVVHAGGGGGGIYFFTAFLLYDFQVISNLFTSASK